MASTGAAATETASTAQHIYLSPELEENIRNRLSRIEGHVRGINGMLAAHKDCESILIQLAAVKSALNQVIIKVLEGHMETCVMQYIVEGQGEEAVESLQNALALVLKKS